MSNFFLMNVKYPWCLTFCTYSFDFCAWQHLGRNCNFTFVKQSGHFLQSSFGCIGNGSKLNFVGSILFHQCSIELHNISAQDNGTWSCYMQDSRKNANDTLTVELLVRSTAVAKIHPTLSTSSVIYPLLQNDETTAATEYPYAIWNEDIQSIPEDPSGGHTMKSEDENEMITTRSQIINFVQNNFRFFVKRSVITV